MNKKVNRLKLLKTTAKLLTVVFFLFNSFICKSQTLIGIVRDSISVVSNANILIKKVNNKDTLQYTYSDNKGGFSIKLRHPKDSVFVEISSLQYKTQIVSLSKKAIKNDTIFLNISLKTHFTQLDDIVIKTAKRIEIRQDTTIYNPEKFKDGTEKTVEDLLKKLPGISVEKNGELKFKGKSIKKLLLDGDDLFNSNYVIGYKNIDVNIVSKVQGIENYDDNALKKGLRDTDDVVLNLVLKKGKSDFSGNAEIGYGHESRYKGNIVGLLLNSQVKLYNYLAYNNIGKSNIEILKNKIHSKSILSEGNFFSILDESFHNFNSNFINSSNVLFKIKEKTSFKTNFNFQTDSKTQNNRSSSIINNDGTILINTTENLNYKPIKFSADIEFNQKENSRLHWNYFGTFNIKNTDFNNLSINNNNEQQSYINTNNRLFQNKADLTYRIDDKKAAEFSINHSFSESPQELSIFPNTQFIINPNNTFEFNNQKSEFLKNYLHIKTDLIGLHNKNQYKIEIGYKYINNKFRANLKPVAIENEEFENNFINNNKYTIQNAYLKTGYSFKFNKSVLAFGLNLQHNILKLNDLINETKQNETSFLVLPYLKFKHKLSKYILLSAKYNYNEVIPEEDKLFSNLVQTNFRSFTKNDITLENLKAHQADLFLKYYDFYNRTTLDFGFIYSHNRNNYFYNNTINQDISISNSFLKNTGLNDYNFILNAETFLLFLNSTIALKTNYNISQDINIINDSDIRDISINSLQSEFVIRTGFKSLINFENTFFYSHSIYKSNVSNTLNNLTNQFKTIIKFHNNFYINATYSYIKPDYNDNINYNFLETEVTFKSKNNNFTYTLVAKNLTNERQFETKSVNDFSTYKSSYNLRERYIMLKFGFSY